MTKKQRDPNHLEIWNAISEVRMLMESISSGVEERISNLSEELSSLRDELSFFKKDFTFLKGELSSLKDEITSVKLDLTRVITDSEWMRKILYLILGSLVGLLFGILRLLL